MQKHCANCKEDKFLYDEVLWPHYKVCSKEGTGMLNCDYHRYRNIFH